MGNQLGKKRYECPIYNFTNQPGLESWKNPERDLWTMETIIICHSQISTNSSGKRISPASPISGFSSSNMECHLRIGHPTWFTPWRGANIDPSQWDCHSSWSQNRSQLPYISAGNNRRRHCLLYCSSWFRIPYQHVAKSCNTKHGQDK